MTKLFGATSLVVVLALSACGGHDKAKVNDSTPKAVATPPSVILTEGEESSTYGRAYKCGEGLDVVQLPVGEKIERDGSSFSLIEKPAKREVYEDQKSVKLTLKLAKSDSLPAIIVNTKAHELWPDLYSQAALKVNIKAGGTGRFTLRTDTYAKNYLDAGITDVTLCLDRLQADATPTP